MRNLSRHVIAFVAISAAVVTCSSCQQGRVPRSGVPSYDMWGEVTRGASADEFFVRVAIIEQRASAVPEVNTLRSPKYRVVRGEEVNTRMANEEGSGGVWLRILVGPDDPPVTIVHALVKQDGQEMWSATREFPVPVLR